MDTVIGNRDVISYVSFWWYSLRDNGEVTLQWDTADYANLVKVRSLQDLGVKVMPTVTNHFDGNWDPGMSSAVLADSALRTRHVARTASLVTEGGFDGVDIDYEDLSETDRDAFTAFVTDLADVLHARGKLLSVTVHPKVSDEGDDGRNVAQDYAALGAAADQLRVMAYDEHWDTSEPGPVASPEWVEDVVRYTLSEVPAAKVVLGLGAYGYDWGPSGVAAEGLTWVEAVDRAQRNGVTPQRDTETASMHFEYAAADGDHEVWFEDATSVERKAAIAARYGLGGVFLWRLGGEDPDLVGRLR